MKPIIFITIIILLLTGGSVVFGLEYDVVDTIENLDIKMDGVAWDGRNIWVITYQSSPILWKIAKLNSDGSVAFDFEVPVDSLDDIHNFGMTNITSDGRFIWANHWNEGSILKYTFKGKLKTKFGVPSVNQLIPVGIAWDVKYLWVLHCSN
jgi:hypothetical protein